MMTTKRPAIPKGVREQVLKEYNHLCSICGEHSPHLHHIDENRTNNDPLNLLPLCPNHHLTDQHNPTSKIDPRILRLFREYRDPTILTPQFKPLFTRLQFLDVDPPAGANARNQVNVSNANSFNLVEFVFALDMGEYYGGKIRTILQNAQFMGSPFSPVEMLASITQLREPTRRMVYGWIMEMLRYQSWWKPSIKSSGR